MVKHTSAHCMGNMWSTREHVSMYMCVYMCECMSTSMHVLVCTCAYYGMLDTLFPQ